MSETLTRLGAFFAAWRAGLCDDSADVRFTAQTLTEPPGLHAACADRFVTSLGYTPIGGNWELLDAEAGAGEPRSARDALVQAFATNMVFSGQAWLGEAAAAALAEDLLACFDPATRQIVTNRMYFGWNPITTARHEWAFVAFDESAIALLLATHED